MRREKYISVQIDDDNIYGDKVYCLNGIILNAVYNLQKAENQALDYAMRGNNIVIFKAVKLYKHAKPEIEDFEQTTESFSRKIF